MSQLLFFLLGAGLGIVSCWLYHALRELDTLVAEDEHAELHK
jgi:hypothetical protein